MREIKVPLRAVGKRADVFVAEKYPQFTRSSLERLFDGAYVRSGQKTLKASHRLKPREVLSINEELLRRKPEKINLPVIYENKDVIVIDKPEGVLTHSKGALNEEATVASFIAPKLNDETLSGNRAGIVHRLDRATSGVIITAKNSGALSKLQKQFSSRKAKKTYLAIVEGRPDLDEASIEAPIMRNPKKPQTFMVGPLGKAAITTYKTLYAVEKNGKLYSTLELKPLTGRTHQIRVHLKYIGHPVLGDKVYGHAGPHLYLHAHELEITLPDSSRRTFRAKLPDFFREYTQ